MAHNQPPGSVEFRALIQPFIDKGSYPQERELNDGEAESLPPHVQKLFIDFFNLADEEDRKTASWGERPKKGSAWAKQREAIRDKLRELLHADISLLAIDMVQQHAISKGAIPDLRPENGGGKYFRTPDHFMAHWVCGTEVLSKDVGGNQSPWCPLCEKEPKLPKRRTSSRYHSDGAWPFQ